MGTMNRRLIMFSNWTQLVRALHRNRTANRRVAGSIPTREHIL